MAADGLPAVRDAVLALAREYRFGLGKTAVCPAKRRPVCVEPGDGRVDRKDRIMVAALAVLRLMVDAAALRLHLADVVVPLKIARIIQRIPEAEFHHGKEVDRFFPVGFVLQGDAR